MKKIVVTLMAAALLSLSVGTAQAETKSSIVLKGTGYGAAIGAIVGASLVALSKEPGDNMQYLYQGAAVGALAGVVYGVYEAETFATIKDGKVKFAMPTVKTQILPDGQGVKASADMLKVNF